MCKAQGVFTAGPSVFPHTLKPICHGFLSSPQPAGWYRIRYVSKEKKEQTYQARICFLHHTPFLARSVAPLSITSIAFCSKVCTAVPYGALVSIVDDEKRIPQGFTSFFKNVNLCVAMIGIVFAIVSKALTGKAIVGLVESVWRIVEHTSAL